MQTSWLLAFDFDLKGASKTQDLYKSTAFILLGKRVSIPVPIPEGKIALELNLTKFNKFLDKRSKAFGGTSSFG